MEKITQMVIYKPVYIHITHNSSGGPFGKRSSGRLRRRWEDALTFKRLLETRVVKIEGGYYWIIIVSNGELGY
jgi:hypothetical protein